MTAFIIRFKTQFAQVAGLVQHSAEAAMDAVRTMEEANRIIEDFPPHKYAIYIFLFLLEIVTVFCIGLSI